MKDVAGVLHPLRRRILAELATPDAAAGLARRLGLPRRKLNNHLRQLDDEGLVEAGASGSAGHDDQSPGGRRFRARGRVPGTHRASADDSSQEVR